MSNNKSRILVVDDEALNIEIMLGMLEGENYQFDVARDGVEAWALLEGNPEAYDVVLLDRMMPRMDGMEVLSRIKSHTLLRHIPVILQTAMNAREHMVEGIRAGAYYYLVKPYDGDVLVSVVRTAARDNRHYRNIRKELRDATRTLGLLRSGRFRYRTLAEARALATLLANACPNSESVAMGLAELMINAVEHGNLGISYQEKSVLNAAGFWEAEVERRLAQDTLSPRQVEVEFSRDEDSIRILITDQGEGFDWEKYLTLSPERALDNHGRGIAMAKMLSFSELEYRGRGNQVAVTISARQYGNH